MSTATDTSTDLVVRRLSIVPQGENTSALERVDDFVLSVHAFTDGSEEIIAIANDFEVNSDAAAQTADVIQDTLKSEVNEWQQRRLEVTRPIDELKTYITSLPKPGVDNRQKAISIYQSKISAYRTRVREAERKAQMEAERLLREERERLDAKARQLEEKAQRLKTEAARQKARDDAERMREQAEMVPESVALAATSESLAASNAAVVWEGRIPLCPACSDADKKRPDPKRRCIHNERLALQTILTKHDEWWQVISFGQAGMNEMSRKYRDTLELPGFKFESRESFRAKPRR